MSMFDWYQRARTRAEQFLSDLDPELEVDVDEDYITPTTAARNTTPSSWSSPTPPTQS